MATTSLHPSVERYLIHEASCRHRKQGLACSTCSDLAERAERVLSRLAAAQLAEVA